MTNAAVTFPDVDLLSYQQTSPKLRVVNPGLGVERAFGMMKSAGTAIDWVVARDGWIAAYAGSLYRLPLASKPPAKLLRHHGPFVAAADPRCVWTWEGHGLWAEYDGLADETRRTVDVGFNDLVATCGHGLVLMPKGGRRHHRRRRSRSNDATCRHHRRGGCVPSELHRVYRRPHRVEQRRHRVVGRRRRAWRPA